MPTTWLPEVSDTMSSDSRMGTPAWTSDPKVWVKPGQRHLVDELPEDRRLQLEAVPLQASVLGLDPPPEQTITPTIDGEDDEDRPHAQHDASRCHDRSASAAGSLACSEAKSFWNIGTMKISRARKMRTITLSTTIG